MIKAYRALQDVSINYSLLGGTLPIHYSPVRHLADNFSKLKSVLVRLACVKHAASVHSEPGSNSPKKANAVCVSRFLFTKKKFNLTFKLLTNSKSLLFNYFSFKTKTHFKYILLYLWMYIFSHIYI